MNILKKLIFKIFKLYIQKKIFKNKNIIYIYIYMDKIIVKNTGKKITLRTAINKGILKDSSNFIVPEGKVIYRKGKSSKIIDINEEKEEE